MVAVSVYSSQTFSFGCKTLATKVASKVFTPDRLSLDAIRVRTLFFYPAMMLATGVASKVSALSTPTVSNSCSSSFFFIALRLRFERHLKRPLGPVMIDGRPIFLSIYAGLPPDFSGRRPRFLFSYDGFLSA